jgi:hypothetical protein
MNELMQRRRALMGQKPSGERWDYVWNYTDGMPEDNGATLVTNGEQTAVMTADGLAISTSSLGWRAYRFPSFQTNSGVIEVDFIPQQQLLQNGNNIRVGYSNGSEGFQTAAVSGVVTPIGRTTPSVNLIADQVNTIKVQTPVNAFWLNGNLIGENLENTTYSANTQVMIQGTNGKIIILRSIRVRRE